MDIAQVEVLIHRVSGLLLPPVSLATTLLFFYAFLMLSGILSQYLQRRRNNRYYFQAVRSLTGEGPALRLRPVRGYPLFSHYQENPHKAADDLEIFALQELERQHAVVRVAVMVGLVATMITIGPVLNALSGGDYHGISEDLSLACAAVIFGLITVAITLWVANVKQHWLVGELNDLKTCLTRQEK